MPVGRDHLPAHGVVARSPALDRSGTTRARTSPGDGWARAASTDAPDAETAVVPASSTCWSKCSTIWPGARATTLPAAGSVRSRLACACAAAGKPRAGAARGSRARAGAWPGTVDLLIGWAGAGRAELAGVRRSPAVPARGGGRSAAAGRAGRQAGGGRVQRWPRRSSTAAAIAAVSRVHGAGQGAVGRPHERRAERPQARCARRAAPGLAGVGGRPGGEQREVGAALGGEHDRRRLGQAERGMCGRGTAAPHGYARRRPGRAGGGRQPQQRGGAGGRGEEGGERPGGIGEGGSCRRGRPWPRRLRGRPGPSRGQACGCACAIEVWQCRVVSARGFRHAGQDGRTGGRVRGQRPTGATGPGDRRHRPGRAHARDRRARLQGRRRVRRTSSTATRTCSGARLVHGVDEALGYEPEWVVEMIRQHGDPQGARRSRLSGPVEPGLLEGIDPERIGRDRPPRPPAGDREPERTHHQLDRRARPTPAWAALVHPDLEPDGGARTALGGDRPRSAGSTSRTPWPRGSSAWRSWRAAGGSTALGSSHALRGPRHRPDDRAAARVLVGGAAPATASSTCRTSPPRRCSRRPTRARPRRRPLDDAAGVGGALFAASRSASRAAVPSRSTPTRARTRCAAPSATTARRASARSRWSTARPYRPARHGVLRHAARRERRQPHRARPGVSRSPSTRPIGRA